MSIILDITNVFLKLEAVTYLTKKEYIGERISINVSWRGQEHKLGLSDQRDYKKQSSPLKEYKRMDCWKIAQINKPMVSSI